MLPGPDDLATAFASGADLVEFDVQLDGSGTPVLAHDAVSADVAHLTLVEALALWPPDGPRAHVDLKFPGRTDVALAVARQAVQALGERTVLTTHDDRQVAVIREWSSGEAPGLLVGLSLGRARPTPGREFATRLRWLGEDLRPRRRLAGCDANLVVCHRLLALVGPARTARRLGLPLMVWTVDRDLELRWFVRPGAAWALTTNRVASARRWRDRLRDTAR